MSLLLGLEFEEQLPPIVRDELEQVIAAVQAWAGKIDGTGRWTDVPYAAGNFSAVNGTWTVDAGDQSIYQYWLSGDIMHLAFGLSMTTITNVTGGLRILLPAGYRIAGNHPYTGLVYASGTVTVLAVITTGTNDRYLTLTRADRSAWTNSTYQQSIQGAITVQVSPLGSSGSATADPLLVWSGPDAGSVYLAASVTQKWTGTASAYSVTTNSPVTVKVRGVAGGGGGGGGDLAVSGLGQGGKGGGGGAINATGVTVQLLPGVTYALAVGASGSAGGVGGNGGNGGNSTFGISGGTVYVEVDGGKGGLTPGGSGTGAGGLTITGAGGANGGAGGAGGSPGTNGGGSGVPGGGGGGGDGNFGGTGRTGGNGGNSGTAGSAGNANGTGGTGGSGAGVQVTGDSTTRGGGGYGGGGSDSVANNGSAGAAGGQGVITLELVSIP